MYYICKRREQSFGVQYGIMDTDDGVVEYYSPQDIISFIKKRNIHIEGVAKNPSTGNWSIKVLQPAGFNEVSSNEVVADPNRDREVIDTTATKGYSLTDTPAYKNADVSMPIGNYQKYTASSIKALIPMIDPLFIKVLREVIHVDYLRGIKFEGYGDHSATTIGYTAVNLNNTGLYVNIYTYPIRRGADKYDVNKFSMCISGADGCALNLDGVPQQEEFELTEDGILQAIDWLKYYNTHHWFTVWNADVKELVNLSRDLGRTLFGHFKTTSDIMLRVTNAPRGTFIREPELIEASYKVTPLLVTINGEEHTIAIDHDGTVRGVHKNMMCSTLNSNSIKRIRVKIADLGVDTMSRLYLEYNILTKTYKLYSECSGNFYDTYKDALNILTPLAPQFIANGTIIVQGTREVIECHFDVPLLTELYSLSGKSVNTIAKNCCDLAKFVYSQLFGDINVNKIQKLHERVFDDKDFISLGKDSTIKVDIELVGSSTEISYYMRNGEVLRRGYYGNYVDYRHMDVKVKSVSATVVQYGKYPDFTLLVAYRFDTEDFFLVRGMTESGVDFITKLDCKKFLTKIDDGLPIGCFCNDSIIKVREIEDFKAELVSRTMQK